MLVSRALNARGKATGFSSMLLGLGTLDPGLDFLSRIVWFLSFLVSMLVSRALNARGKAMGFSAMLLGLGTLDPGLDFLSRII